MAEGVLHFFEGWVIFLACAAILAAEIYLLARIGSGKSFFQVFHLPKVTASLPRGPQIWISQLASDGGLLGSVVCSGTGCFLRVRSEGDRAGTPALRGVSGALGQWQGRPSLLEPQVEHALGLEDYILSDYSKAKERRGQSLRCLLCLAAKRLVTPFANCLHSGRRLADHQIRANQLQQRSSRANVTSKQSCHRAGHRTSSSSIIGSFSAVGISQTSTGRNGTCLPMPSPRTEPMAPWCA